MSNVPVLILIFNRPEKTKRLMKRLEEIKPEKIYIGADGPRNPEELKITDETREVANRGITWKCKKNHLYREKNLGCREAVSQSISWFFKQEPAGIILEDDCLPTQSFFAFCESLLSYYGDDSEVMHISGLNLAPLRSAESYHFSKYPRVWGWASWRRAWEKYDDQTDYIKRLHNSKTLKAMFERNVDYAFWRIVLEKLLKQKGKTRRNSWAYHWALNIRHNRGLCIVPNKNQIQNIGFDIDSTSTAKLTRLERMAQKALPKTIDFPLVHPSKTINAEQDRRFVDHQLIDSKAKLYKVYLKIIFPFLKPLS